MFRKLVMAVAAAVVLAGAAAAQPAAAPAAWKVPADDEIRKILVERIDVQKDGVGIVVGVVDAHGRRIVAYGARGRGDAAPLNADTVFESGSMTKVFTSVILADMVRTGEVTLDDPVQALLPASVKIPDRNGARILLKDLATHTSALPRLPNNMRPQDPTNPDADYTVDQMYAFLSGYTLTRDIGAQYEYSNLAVGLLGHALAVRAGADYETLVRQRITGPLRMSSTSIRLTPELQARLAKPYAATLEPSANWDLPTLAGAGALRSTANDMMTFLAAAMGLQQTPLKPAFDTTVTALRRPAGGAMSVALGWHVRAQPGGGEVIWHNGGTGGYRSFMGYNPATKVGVVVLTNAATPRGGDDIGVHLLAGAPLAPAPPPRVVRTAIVLPEAELEAFVGRYQVAPQVLVTVTREGRQLFAQLTGQPRAEVFPESPTKVFWKIVDAQATFEKGPDGKAGRVILHQMGRNTPAERIP